MAQGQSGAIVFVQRFGGALNLYVHFHALTLDGVFHDEDGEVAPGITVHRMPGHTMGMQAVRVQTTRGAVLLASDAWHYYEHWVRRVPFSICWSQGDLLASYRRFEGLAESEDHVIPGHDPLVRELYPGWSRETGNEIVQLHLAPVRPLKQVFK